MRCGGVAFGATFAGMADIKLLPVIRIEREGPQVRPRELPPEVADLDCARYQRTVRSAARREKQSLLPSDCEET